VDVTAYDPFVSDDEVRAAGVRPATLEELLERSDAISVHAPLTPETRGLIGAEELSRLPQGALVVNAARADLVDTHALLRALDSGRVGGVALDVLDVEPPTAETPAPTAPRLVVNPHAGWYSEEAQEAAHRRATESVLDVLEGRRPTGAVNEPA
jgi:D-3-phosphoglycerate dehydrogenase